MADVKPKGCIIKDPLVFFLLERNINDDVIVRSIRLERGEWHQFVEEQQALYKVSKMSKLSLELLSILLFIGVQSTMITCANLLSFSLSRLQARAHSRENLQARMEGLQDGGDAVLPDHRTATKALHVAQRHSLVPGRDQSQYDAKPG